MPRARTSSRPAAALVGLLAGAVALALGELVAGILGGSSPVVSVGDAAIDRVPPAVKDLAIELFGTNDKVALVVGILLVLATFAAVVGVVAARRPLLGAAGIGLFGLVGALASRTDSSSESFLVDVTPSVVGALAGIALLLAGRRAPQGPLVRAPEGRPAVLARRQFLGLAVVTAAAAGGLGTAGRWLQAQASAATSRAAVVLPRAVRRLRPVPAGADLGIDGVVPFVTPNRDFYRIDTALLVPQVKTEGWTLRIHGMVERELELTYDELLARDLVEADVTMTCVSNEVGGGLLGNARWLGARLDDLLREAGVRRGATQVVPRSVDGYAAGFPTEVAMDGREALVAVGMNGEPLPLDHGFPARLVVPGLYGYVSATKWLKEIELTTLDAFDSYWVRRGWAKEAPIKTSCRIDTPRGLARLQPGRVPVAGVAWAQGRGIRAVEVRVDDGPWAPARLATAVGDDTWRQWVLEWDATPGTHSLQARATDGTGALQVEEREAPIPEGATGWHTVQVTVQR